MILVSAFYVITWMPNYVYYLILNVSSNLTMLEGSYYVTVFMAFLYVSANPFIYATKFDPVNRVLVGLIPWKKSSPGGSVDAVVSGGTGTGKTGTTNERN